MALNVRELGKCESIGQVYGHLHDMLSLDQYKKIGNLQILSNPALVKSLYLVYAQKDSKVR